MVSVKNEDHIDLIFAGGMMLHVSHKTLIFDMTVQVWLEFTILIKMIREQFSYSLWSVAQKSLLD